jgi:hypothetical protein
MPMILHGWAWGRAQAICPYLDSSFSKTFCSKPNVIPVHREKWPPAHGIAFVFDRILHMPSKRVKAKHFAVVPFFPAATTSRRLVKIGIFATFLAFS